MTFFAGIDENVLELLSAAGFQLHHPELSIAGECHDDGLRTKTNNSNDYKYQIDAIKR